VPENAVAAGGVGRIRGRGQAGEARSGSAGGQDGTPRDGGLGGHHDPFNDPDADR
jgi:hypothetical protein